MGSEMCIRDSSHNTEAGNGNRYSRSPFLTHVSHHRMSRSTRPPTSVSRSLVPGPPVSFIHKRFIARELLPSPDCHHTDRSLFFTDATGRLTTRKNSSGSSRCGLLDHAGPVQAHSVGRPRVPGEQPAIAPPSDHRMAETPLAHIFPELGVIDVLPALGNRRLLIMNVNNQAGLLGPGAATVN